MKTEQLRFQRVAFLEVKSTQKLHPLEFMADFFHLLKSISLGIWGFSEVHQTLGPKRGRLRRSLDEEEALRFPRQRAAEEGCGGGERVTWLRLGRGEKCRKKYIKNR